MYKFKKRFTMRETKSSRILAFLLAALLLLGVFSAGGPVAFAEGEDDRKTLTVGFDADFPPYGYKDTDGSYIGFDLDLAEEVCKRRGWKLIKQPIDWNSKDMELESGSIDCIWNGFTIQGREDSYTWSKPYIDNSQVIVVRASSEIQKPEDLAGKTVIVQADSSALAAFTGEDAEQVNKDLAASFSELQQVADYNSAFMNLEAGAADAVCLDIGVAQHELINRGDSFRMLDAVISTEQYGVGFRLGDTELRNQVQETLDEMAEDGTFRKIAEIWGLSDNICLGNANDREDSTAESSEEGKEAVTEAVTDTGNKKEDNNFFEKFWSITKQLGTGMLASLAIFFLTLIFSMPLGLLLTAIRMSRFKVIQWLAKIYISIMRGTPLMLQLLVVFFGPHFIFGVETSSSYRFYAVIIGFSLNYAAYFAEIFRAGIEGVPLGQREAADVLGYTRIQTFWKIIFPQMAKRVIPPVTNEIITLVKDTSLAFALAYTEMFTLAKQVTAAESSILPLFVAGLFYYVFNILVAAVMARVEKNMRYYDRHTRVKRREIAARKARGLEPKE